MATHEGTRLRATAGRRVLAGHDHSLSGRTRSVPRRPDPWIERLRLDALVETACRRRLTVVTGPPGAGKTAALAAWAAGQHARRVVWLSLDRREDERRGFWPSLVAALHESCSPRTGERVHCAGEHPAEAAARALEASPPCVVVLDDLHALTDAVVLNELGQLLRRLPAHVSVVVSGRGDPPLPLARLQAEGEVAAIGYGELRLAPGEAEALLRATARRPLSRAQTEAVTARAEGWAAALKLAALRLRDAPDLEEAVGEITSGTGWIEPYVVEEILAPCSPEHGRFLRLTALADRVTPDLCRALTGATQPERALGRVAARHELLEGDRLRGWRYHALLAEVLRSRLEAEDPAAYAEGLRRCARHSERSGDVAGAIRFYESAHDPDGAFAAATEETLAQLHAGVVGQGPNWLELVASPAAVGAGDDPLRPLAGAIGALAAGMPFEAAQWLRRAERSTAGEATGSPPVGLALLRSLAAQLTGDAAAMRTHAEAALGADGADGASERSPLEGPQPAPAWARHLEELGTGLAPVLLARAQLWLGDDGAAEKVAADAPRRGPDPLTSTALQGLRAAALAHQGRLGEAAHLARAAIDAAEALRVPPGPATLDAELAMGSVHCERGQPHEAQPHLQAAARLAGRSGNEVLRALAELELVPPLLLTGELGAAFDLLVRQRDAGRAFAVVGERLDTLELRWRLAAGDVNGAAAALDRLPPRRRTAVLEARLDLLAGRPGRALARLGEAALAAEGSLLERTERLVLTARAAHQTGTVHRARDAMHRALELARPEAIARPFLENRDQVRWLLRSLPGTYPDPFVDRLRDAVSTVSTTGGRRGADRAPAALVEGLTEREREALSLLPSHLTQQQIAADLYVSVNTLKTHLKGLYRKLGATSRSEAVAAARLHGLV